MAGTLLLSMDRGGNNLPSAWLTDRADCFLRYHLTERLARFNKLIRKYANNPSMAAFNRIYCKMVIPAVPSTSVTRD